MVENILIGKLKKSFFGEQVLLEQGFVFDDTGKKTVGNYLQEQGFEIEDFRLLRK